MSVPRPVLKVGVAVFLFAMAVYSTAAVYYSPRRFPAATLGVAGAFAAGERGMHVNRVDAAGAADRAGVRAGDRIVAINGQALTTIYPFWDAVDRGQPGETVRLTVHRPGEPDVRDVAVRLDKYRLPIEFQRTPMTAARLAALRF